MSKATSWPKFNWEDPVLLEESLSEDEGRSRGSARACEQDEWRPRGLEANRHEIFDRESMTETGAQGLLGSTVEG